MPPHRSIEAIWRAYDDDEQRLSAPLSERMLALAGLAPGMRVLDIASGRGEPAIRAARRVGPTGSVLGIDLSASMLDMARARAAAEGVTNLELRVGDAEALDEVPPAHFHAALARWCLMYMDAPVAALAAIRRALVPGAPLVGAVWTERAPYYTLPRRLLAAYRPIPEVDPTAPGVFHYADEGRLRRDLAAAGWTVQHVEEMDVAVMAARSGAELVAWTRAFGMARLLEGLPEEMQAAWERDLVAAAPWSDGVVRLGGVTRIVVATA